MLLAGALLGCKAKVQAPEPAVVGTEAAVEAVEAVEAEAGPDGEGEEGLPRDPLVRGLLEAQCQICHTVDYVRQQRLTEAQWKATVAKMVSWGAPLDAAQAEALVAALTRAYPPDRPDWSPPTAPAPAGE